MRKIISLFIVLFLLSATANAKPLEGFHAGPYLTVEIGLVQSSADDDQQANSKVGANFERSFGVLFGWNLNDYFATEIKGRYSTNQNQGRRQHLVNANLGGRYSFIFDKLTDFKSLRILPYVSSGIALRIASLPGNIQSSNSAITALAVGPYVGTGVTFMWKKYLYFGANLSGDLLFQESVRQDLDLASPALSNQLIYNGGFQPAFSTGFILGVHY